MGRLFYRRLCLLFILACPDFLGQDVLMFKKEPIFYLAHLPTFLLIIGYPIFWLEFYGLSRHGVTTPLALIIWALVVVVVLRNSYVSIQGFFNQTAAYLKKQFWVDRLWFMAGIVLMWLLLSVGFWAASLPLHLMQESDALNYHYTLVRQHLITHSFAHIPWSHADLFLLPINFALAPFWFVTALPNKFPQFIFFLGMIAVGVRVLQVLKGWQPLAFVLFVLCVFGSHHLGIQLGTAMLDVVILYLFLAFLDSLLRGNWWLASVELVFYFWSKPFVPLQTIAIIVALMICLYLGKKFLRMKVSWEFSGEGALEGWSGWRPKLTRIFLLTAVLSIFVAGPFLAKSTYYSGTPLFPFAPGIVNINPAIDRKSPSWESLVASAKENIRCGRENYGYGRGPLDFVKHLWLIAVPDEGVNNRFDYPVGLIYILVVGPFLFYAIKDVLNRRLSLLAVIVGLFWGSWWFGSLQTRFLYIPIALMVLVVISHLKNISHTLKWIVLAAVILNALSVVRAHKPDFFQNNVDVLRAKDKEIVEFNKKYLSANREDVVTLEFQDAPFAQFPFKVKQQNLPYVIVSE